jgi:hypothetical protein
MYGRLEEEKRSRGEEGKKEGGREKEKKMGVK